MKIFYNKSYKHPLFWFAIVFLIYAFYKISLGEISRVKVITISEFMTANSDGKIVAVDMGSEYLHCITRDGERFAVAYPIYYSGKLIDELLQKNVNIRYVAGDADRSVFGRSLSFIGGIISWLPLLFILWLWFSAFKGMGSGKGNGGGGIFGGGAFGFGKSKAKMIRPEDLKVTFADVAGVDEAKEDLREIVDFLQDPQRYQNIGGKIPKGCLLSGSPGTGKTLLAKAIAAEAGVPFFFISGSDFVEVFVGVGASRVRDMFSQAKRHSPCIIFIDEIDAVGRSRGIGVGGGNDEREQTLNQLLVEMDGFEDNGGVVVVAATNRPDVLDVALMRPGRFDRQIVVSLPDINGRNRILEVHSVKVKMAPSVDLKVLARGTAGFSGADLANLINEAALLAARRAKNIVTNDELEDARDKILMGSERKTLMMKKEEKELTAYHEGGHALVAVMLPASDPVHKATIIPRGRALGLVMRLPEGDTFSVTREKMFADLSVAMAGRVAEEAIFGYDKVTSGAASDIEQVTKMARAMVTQWGLSDKVGNVNYVNDTRDYGAKNVHRISESMAKIIDDEVQRIAKIGYDTAKKIITENIDILHKIASALLEFETLTGDEIKDVIAGKSIIRHVAAVGERKSTMGAKINVD